MADCLLAACPLAFLSRRCWISIGLLFPRRKLFGSRKGTLQLSPPPFGRSEPERKRRKAAEAAMSRVLGSCRVLMAAAKGGAQEPAARAATKVAAAAPPAAAAATKRKGGLWKPVQVSPAMKKFLGVQETTRMEAVKKIWEHIKANQLQNPADKREIHCDQKLKMIFDGKDKVGMFEIAKLLAPHFLKPQ